MKLPGDSDKQNKGVSHEMMQRSLQSQRRVVKRVGLLEDKVEQLENVEDRVDDLENTEIEPGTQLGDLADGAKKIAKGIGKSVGKNASLLADKAGKGLKKAGKSAASTASKNLKSAADATGKGIKDAADATGKGIKKQVGKAGDKLTDVGKGIRNFIKDKTKLAKSLGKDKPKSPTGSKPEGEGAVSGSSTVKPPAPSTQPLDPLIPDPVAAQSKDKEGNTIYDKNERIRQFYESQGKEVPAKYAKPSDSPKVESLENVGASEDDATDKVKKDLSDEFEIDPKMKRAFSEALALPAKSAAVAMTDLLEKIPAPSKEASKILNRNISKISQSFNLGAASAEVANDEESNDSKESENKAPRWQVMLGNLLGKVIPNRGGGEEGGVEQSSAMVPSPGGAAVGDPSHGRRAPYTGTADGIGLGDGGEGSRAMQPIKKRKSLAKKLFGMTPMGMAFNAGNSMFKGMKSFTQSKTFNNMKGVAGKAFGMTPMGMMAKFAMKSSSGLTNIFNKGEQTTNLTELTDKTIQDNRVNADMKTEKQVAIATGVTGGVGSSPSPQPSQQEGSELAQPEIIDSPYLDLYNTTSQF